MSLVVAQACFAQQPEKPNAPSTKKPDKQINVSWIYGSYIPKDVPIVPLTGKQRFKLYLNQTYTTPGIYVETTLFALRDQIAESPTEWGNGFGGFAKRLGTREAQFIIQNTINATGFAIVGWEPRYDRCRCDGFWLRTRHAVARNFVTYGRDSKALRPQIMPYIGAFAGGSLAATWKPGNPNLLVQGYQGAISQVGVGIVVNWVGEFAPEIFGVLHKKKN